MFRGCFGWWQGGREKGTEHAIAAVTFRGCFGDVSGMFRGCSGDVSGMFRGCSGDVSGMFWGCSGDVLGISHRHRPLCTEGGHPQLAVSGQAGGILARMPTDHLTEVTPSVRAVCMQHAVTEVTPKRACSRSCMQNLG